MRRLSVEEIESVDNVCLRFEDQWLDGSPPVVGEFIIALEGRIRTAALVELIALDLDYRTRHGQIRTPGFYHSLFPEDRETVEAAFLNLRLCELDSGGGSNLFPFATLAAVSEYQVERFLARGGLGEIFLARDTQLDRTVAIKVPRNRDPNSLEWRRLSREAEITGMLKHPGIVPVHAKGLDQDQQPYYVMQYVEGQTMKDAIENFHLENEARSATKYSTVRFRQLLQHLISVSKTIAYAHEQGFMHRDIKPGNIMLGEFGETILLDWGLAKEIALDKSCSNSTNGAQRGLPPTESWRFNQDETAAATHPGQPIGTPEFASPEQIQGRVEDQDVRSDVYSLGATLYCLLVGARPIQLDDVSDASAVLNAVRNMVSPKAKKTEVPADLNAICLKAISFEAANRFQSVGEFSDELERFILDEPIRTRAQSWSNRLRRRMKANPRTAYSMVSGITVAAAALAVSSLLLSQKNDQLAKSLTTQQEMNIQLESAKESAEAYADKTGNALRTMFNRIDETWFASRKSFSVSERRLLQDMLIQFQEFARSNTNPYFTRTVEAAALERVGRIQALLGRNSEAIESFRNAANLINVLPADAAENIRKTQAKTVYQLGSRLCEIGELENGLRQMEEAFELTLAMSRDFPDNPEHLNRLAIIQSRLGSAQLLLGHRELAYEQMVAAKVSSEKLVDRFPENTYFRQTLATRMTYLGKTYLRFNDFQLALEEFQSAVAIFESFGNREWIFNAPWRGLEYCDARNGVARSLARLGRVEESLVAWGVAGVSAERLAEKYPAFPNVYSNLALPSYQSAVLLRKQKEWTRAVDLTRSAIKAIENAVRLSPGQRNFFRLRTVINKELGLILQDSGDLVAAEGALRQSVVAARESFEIDPDFANGNHGNRLELARTLRCLGHVQVEQDDTESAKQTFNKSISVLTTASNEYLQEPHVQQELSQSRQALQGVQ